MGGSKIINTYFNNTESKLNYKRTDGVIGFKYNSRDKENKDEILRLFIDNNLEACISKISYKEEKIYLYEHEEASDILIIGFSLEGQIFTLDLNQILILNFQITSFYIT